MLQLFFVLSVLFSTLSLAQDDFLPFDPTTPPLNVETYLPEGYRVLEAQPQISWGNTYAAFYLDEQWRYRPYPIPLAAEGACGGTSMEQINPGLYRFEFSYCIIDSDSVEVEDVWLYDLAQDQFYRPETTCDSYTPQTNQRLGPPINPNVWVTVETGEGTKLCNTLNGQLTRSSLPPELIPSYPLVGYPISTNGEWYIHIAAQDDIYFVSAYNFVNRETFSLGEILTPNCQAYSVPAGIDIIAWNTPSQFTIYEHPAGTHDMSSCGHNLYLGDVSAQSLREVHRQYLSIMIEDGQYLWNSDNTQISGQADLDPDSCQLHFYDPSLAQETVYKTPGLCEIGTKLSGYERVYRLETGTCEAPTADIVRYDLETHTRQVIYSGEVDELLYPSPDGQYLAMTLGDSGGAVSEEFHQPIEMLASDAAATVPCMGPYDVSRNLVVLDVQSQKVALEIGGPVYILNWVDTNKLQFTASDILNLWNADDGLQTSGLKDFSNLPEGSYWAEFRQDGNLIYRVSRTNPFTYAEWVLQAISE